MKRRWEYQPDAPIPAWIASHAHERAPSASLFVWTVDGITEVRPGEWISKARGGVRAQVLRATDAA